MFDGRMQAKTLKAVSGALVLAVGGSAYFAFRTVRPKTVAIVARTVTATTGSVTETISASGTVQAAAITNVSAPVSAQIAELPVRVGDVVKIGEIVAKLDPSNARNQLDAAKSNLASAQAKLQQSLDGLTRQERAQLALATEQSAVQVKSAARSLQDQRANARQTAKSYSQSVESARTSLDASIKTAELNAANYLAAIETAKASIDSGKASALINQKTYQSTIENAQASLENAKKTAEINARTYQNSVDLAQGSVNNAKINAGFSATSTNNAVNQATQTLSSEITTLQGFYDDLARAQQRQRELPPTATPQETSAAQTNVDTAQSKINSQTKTVASAQTALANQQLSAASTAAKDSQSIQSAEQNTLFNSLTSQTLGLAKDQQTIAAAEISVKSAITAQESGINKDNQTIASAETSLRNAITSQTSGLLKDSQTVTQAQVALRNASGSQTSGLLKDRQAGASAEASLASAELSLRNTRVSNSLKLAPAKRADLLSLESQVSSAEVAVRTAEQNLSELTVTAKTNGVITALNVAVGDSPGQTPIATITAVDDLEVKVGFSEANAAKLKNGQRGVISFDAVPTVAISSVVSSVDQIATSVQNVATYFVIMKVPGGAANGVKPGMTSSVEIIVNEATDTVVVPSSAISTFGGRKSVTLRKNGVDTRTVVEAGILGSQGTQVTSGVESGDVLVLPAVSTNATVARITGVGNGGGTGAGGGAGRIGG